MGCRRRGRRGGADLALGSRYVEDGGVENWSLSLDFKVLLLTVRAVLRSGED